MGVCVLCNVLRRCCETTRRHGTMPYRAISPYHTIPYHTRWRQKATLLEDETHPQKQTPNENNSNNSSSKINNKFNINNGLKPVIVSVASQVSVISAKKNKKKISLVHAFHVPIRRITQLAMTSFDLFNRSQSQLTVFVNNSHVSQIDHLHPNLPL